MNNQTLSPRSRHSRSSVSHNAVVSRSVYAADSITDAANDYMAGSPRNPLLNEQWRTDDFAAREHHHFSGERERVRDKRDRRQQSPPFPRRGRGRDRGHPSRGRGGSNANHQPLGRHPGSRGRGDKKSRGSRPPGHFSSHQRPFHPEDQDPGFPFDEAVRSRPPEWEDHPPPSPNPPFKRRRTRSPSPYPRHHPSFKQKRGRGKDFPPRGKKHRGRDFSPRGAYRGKQRPPGHRPDPSTAEYFYDQRRGRSGSPFSREGQRDLSPASHYYDSHYDRPFAEQDPREFASPSSPRHSIYSRASRESPRPPSLREDPTMQQTRPIQSIVDDRSPSPLRPIPTFDTDNSFPPDDSHPRPRESFSMRGMRQSGGGRGSHRGPRPHIDTRQPFGASPQYVTPNGSRHGSPQSGSPYSSGRGSWGGQPPPSYRGHQEQMHGYSPPYRQNSASSSHGMSQAEYYQSQQGQYAPATNHAQGGYPPPPYRGGPSGYRGGRYSQPQNRHFSAPNAQNYNTPPQQRNQNARFNNFQWTASSGRGRGSPQLQPGPPPRSMAPMQQSPQFTDQRISSDLTDDEEDDNPFRPSKALRVEDQNSKPEPENGDAKTMPPPQAPQSTTSDQPKEKGTGKFSFAFKSKAAPPPTTKPVPDLAQRMREPPRPMDDNKSRKSSVPPPREKHDYRQDRRDDRRDSRRGDRRFDQRAERKRDRREERRMEAKHERRHNRHDRKERSPPPPKKPKKIMKRMKPRPTLTEEFAASDSVYYRKPGNESVIGAGTYGKVFKAVHVYTENKVALKKIRMEGEKDGFPITAVREIRLLQHLRHENVVRLQEVMVEKNECFMVFEYLSHDLTGLINHPTFSLTAAHKKHLAKQMFEGLNYLHHRGVLHRDIKAANILISNQGLLKYADFGLARFFSKSRQLDYTNRVITIWYRPPELLLGETRYGPAVDVWSAACVYVEMFTKKAVFPGEGGEISQLDKLYNSLGTPTRTDWPGIIDMPWFELLRPRERKNRTFEDTYKEVLSPEALDLVGKMFQYDPAKRPTAEEVLAHPYFTTEEPLPQQATELASIEGDWHEFESKAHRKEKSREARRAEYQREKEKRRVSADALPSTDRDPKRAKLNEVSTSQPVSLGTEN